MQDQTGAHSLRVLTYNILCACAEDEHPLSWDERRAPLAELIKAQDPDLIGLQEPLLEQLSFLLGTLVDYDWVGVARADGREQGELNPILYRRGRFELLDTGAFWLSPTPMQPGSIGWDAEWPRIVTWALLRERVSGRGIQMFNTHWDYVGARARLESASLLASHLGAVSADRLRILTGDFNCDSSEEPYRRLLAEAGREADGAALVDARTAAEQAGGPAGTFPAERNASPPRRKVDHIFTDATARVSRQVVVGDPLGSTYPSDHLPVMAELEWSSQD